jgi:hypothetical protein
LTPEAAEKRGASAKSVSRLIDRGFRRPHTSVALLSNAQLRVVPEAERADGRLHVVGTVDCEVRAPQEIQDLMLAIRTLGAAESEIASSDTMQVLGEGGLTSGTIQIDTYLAPNAIETGASVQLYLLGFAMQPKPNNYRLTNELQATLEPLP